MTAFEEMAVMPELAEAVEEMDWSLPTDIQAEGIPMILGGGDVLMAAETGSGKTGAFCLPILQIVYETMRDMQEGKMGQRARKGTTAGGGGGGVSKKWQMNVFDRTEAMAIDVERGLCQSRDQKLWHGCRSNKGVTGSGKYYYEATVTDEGLCRVGWATTKGKLELGLDNQSYGFGGTGKKSFSKQFDSYGEPYGLSDVLGCYINLDDMTIKWSKNGVDFGVAYTIQANLRKSPFFAAVCLKNAELKFNFGDSPFAYPPQGGYQALSKAPSECVVESCISSNASEVGPATRPPNAPYAIIIEPSRELAEQTSNQIKKFKKHLKNPYVTDVLLVGGTGAKEQVETLMKGVDIVVGTPGRMADFISTGKLSLVAVRFFVLDEADGLLAQGNAELINRLHRQIPGVTSDGRRLQMVVCSATLHSIDVRRMADRLMHFPTWIDLKGQDSVPETVHHVVLRVDPRKDQRWKQTSRHITTDEVHAKDRLDNNVETPELLSEAVKTLKGFYTVDAIRKFKMDRAIIFCRTKVDCDNMESYLNTVGEGMSCICLHGDRRPQERKANLEAFKKNEVRFLICTDVAARGLDITGLPYVINVTLPDEKQNYVHRIGRVGRAERMGLAISFAASVKEKVWYHSNCSNRGKGCYNTQLVPKGGCCIWYNEPQYLGEIEEHLGVTIDQVGPELEVPVNEYDGKVVYGQKLKRKGPSYEGHVASLAPTVKELYQLEKRAQTSYFNLLHQKPFLSR